MFVSSFNPYPVRDTPTGSQTGRGFLRLPGTNNRFAKTAIGAFI